MTFLSSMTFEQRLILLVNAARCDNMRTGGTVRQYYILFWYYCTCTNSSTLAISVYLLFVGTVRPVNSLGHQTIDLTCPGMKHDWTGDMR